MTIRDEIAESFERLLIEACPPKQVRIIEAGGGHRTLWQQIEQSGFLDALVPEHAGGAGLSLADAFPIAELAGRHAVPLPVAETMVLRNFLADAGIEIPSGSITFGGTARRTADGITASQVVCANAADYVLVELAGENRLLPTAGVAGDSAEATLNATMNWPASAWEAALPIRSQTDPLLVQALTHTIQSVGAMATVFERTLQFANDRQQFGKPIGKFQAIQHQLSVMAEHLFAARMAAEIAASRLAVRYDRLKIAIAKARAAEAAVEVAGIGHSIHGAIGFTKEYDLQLLTRRLHGWRQAAGCESYWQTVIGQIALQDAERPILDLLRRATQLDQSTTESIA